MLTLLVLVLVVALVHLGWRAQRVVAHLQAAADRAPVLVEQLTALDVGGARSTASAMQAETSEAVAITEDPVWRLAARFPWGGQNLRAAGAGARAADHLARAGGDGAVRAASALADARSHALTLDVVGARDDVARARDEAAAVIAATALARGELDGLDRRYLVPPAASALARVESAADDVEALEASLADPLTALTGA